MTRAEIASSVLSRWIVLLGAWVALAGVGRVDLVVGMVAAALGTAASIVLLPPSPARRSTRGLLGLALRFPAQSLIAGLDVAIRALAVPVRVSPGLVEHRARLGRGLPRSAFRAFASLQPGSLPVGEAKGDMIVVHHLDVGGDVAGSFGREQSRFVDAIGEDRT